MKTLFKYVVAVENPATSISATVWVAHGPGDFIIVLVKGRTIASASDTLQNTYFGLEDKSDDMLLLWTVVAQAAPKGANVITVVGADLKAVGLWVGRPDTKSPADESVPTQLL